MEAGRPSSTAFSAARYRAAHQLLDGGRVFTDPYAVAILGRPESEVRADAEQPGRRLMRLFIAARTRFAEDTLARAYGRGIRQLVVLGAGLDTFAYRNPYPDLRVFEVDHPDTQAWKKLRLAAAGVPVPPTVTYLPIDFERQTLADRLDLAPAPTFFSWLGVVPYLTRDAFDATIGHLAGVGGAEVVFDYAEPPASLPPERRASHAERAARVARLGEPWRTYFRPAELREILRDFADVEDLGPAQLAGRYFGRPDLPPDTPGGHVLHARRG
jgi:methyltransferase (TIGR00027 family)